MDDQLKMHAADKLGAQENRAYQPAHDQHVVNTLREAGFEIEHLRGTVAELSPDARFGRAFVKLIDLLSAGSEPVRGYGVDTVWRIKSLVEEIEAPMRAQKAQAEFSPGEKYPGWDDMTNAERDFVVNGPLDTLSRVEATLDQEAADARALAKARSRIASVLAISTDPDNAFASDYLLGMANGLILAQSIVNDAPSDVEVPFLRMPEKASEDIGNNREHSSDGFGNFTSTAAQDLGGAALASGAAVLDRQEPADLGPFDYETPRPEEFGIKPTPAPGTRYKPDGFA